MGTLLIALAVFPLLAGFGVVYKAFDNTRQTVTNAEFPPRAWHNLPADEVFPDHLGFHGELREQFQGTDTWTRMGIADETSCSEALSPQFLADVESRGCRTVLRATYVDIGGSVAATTAIVVLESRQQADELLGIVDEALYVGDVAPVVRTHPLPGTPLDGRWNDDARVGSAVSTVGVGVYEKPYLVLVTAGPADGRAVAQLPEPWTRSGKKEVRAYFSIADHVARHLTSKFDIVMEEDADE